MRQVIKMCKVLIITECSECPYYRRGVMGQFCGLAHEYTPISRENKRIPDNCRLENMK